MAFKEWFQKLKPMQLYIMLVLTGIFFAVELIISHFTHSLTLLVDSYHMLCNMIALIGYIITIKKLHPGNEKRKNGETAENAPQQNPTAENQKVSKSIRESENSLKNTFGWARIDILVMLIGCIFLASLCFSVLVEAVQTLIHINNRDEMHFPLVILMVGAAGLLLNGFCYTLIGGYTFHQGSYLHVTETGEVILERAVTIDSLKKGQRRLSSQARRSEAPSPPQRQGIREMIRDILGCIFVIVCALLVYFTSGHQFAKFLDPVISLISAMFLFLLSYPYMKESGLILLQTIPADINIDSLRLQLLQAFPDVVSVHDLHVWQFTAEKIISTAHIIFVDPTDYLRINKQITQFFNDQGITQLTIQPEFTQESSASSSSLRQTPETTPCLMNCLKDECRKRNCCLDSKNEESSETLHAIRIDSGGDSKTEPEPSPPTRDPSPVTPEPETNETNPIKILKCSPPIE